VLHDARERVVVGAELDLAHERRRATERVSDSLCRTQATAALATDLARDVKDDVVAFEPAKPVDEPVDVLLEVLHDVEHGAVGPEPLLAHDVLERDEVGNIERARIGQRVVGRVEVDNLDRPAPGGQELVDACTVGALAGAWRADEAAQWSAGHRPPSVQACSTSRHPFQRH